MTPNDSAPPPRDPWLVNEGYGANEMDQSHPTNPSLYAKSLPIKRPKATIPRPSDSWPKADEDATEPAAAKRQLRIATEALALFGVTFLLIGLVQRHSINGWELAGIEFLALWLWLRAFNN